MVIHEFINRVEVKTPKGDGILFFVIDYGHESDTVYTVIINDTGEMWQFRHKDLIVKSNITFGRNGY